MLSLQRPNSSMEQDFSHGLSPSTYDQDRQRRAWAEQVPYSAPYSSDAPTQLPPIQTAARLPYEQASSSSYDPTRRPAPLPTTVGQSYSPYTTQPPQSPYGHGIAQYQHNQHLYNQSTPQMSPVSQQFPPSTYSPIRPMLAPAQPHNMSGGYAPTAGYNFPQHPEDPTDSQPRLHVVGSQGRRGVLPSDDGRPPAIPNGATGTKSTVIPQKDADGKFPCPHCQKTYLHGKHLKRHLLRHTGDRPYSCFLCNDTFSRSDILKRHFQKCSQRRGNPTGASHLAYSQNHLKRQAAKNKQQQQQAAQQGLQGNNASTDGSNSAVTQASLNNNNTASIYADSNVGMATMNNTQHQLADSSIKHYGDSTRSGGILSPGSTRPNHNFLAGQPGPASLPSSGSSTPLTAKTTNGQFPQTYQNDPSRSGYSDMSHRGQLPGTSHFEGSNNAFEWSPAYAHGKDTSGSVYTNDHLAGQSTQQSINSDNQQEIFKTATAQGGLHDSTHQAIRSIKLDQEKIDRLITFCQLDNPTTLTQKLLRQSLTVSNVQHFIQQYFENFYQHFPIIHIPSFDPITTYDGLLLAIICTGAVYSDRLDIEHTRELARITGDVLKNILQCSHEPGMDFDISHNVRNDEISEQLHAYASILSLKLWHGDDDQKVDAMENWSTCTQLALTLKLDRPAMFPDSRWSVFHQAGDVESQPVEDFTYSSWLWQEKRIRLMYIIFLTDAVLAFFFNRLPVLEPSQLKIPLPCDDDVWEASDELECANALGLHGKEQQLSNNFSGSQRKKQPEMHLAVAALGSSLTELAPRCTNAAGKFLLIHGLLVQAWMAQASPEVSLPEPSLQGLDWVISSTAHPPNQSKHSNLLERIESATDKWIKAWDRDIFLQYPPGIERVGYSRDGVHYYWLAKLLIQNCDYVHVHSPWNERFHQILKLLKNVKTWVSGNQLIRGETTGAVSLIDEEYGLSDLSKDLKLLLAPV